MKSLPKIGASGELSLVVGSEHAITFAGEGMPAVLSTPHLIGLLERTAREAVADCLDTNERTVGTEIDLRHLAPTPLGQTVTCRARLIHAEGRSLTFQVEAHDARELIARGTHKRAVIQVEAFTRRVASKSV